MAQMMRGQEAEPEQAQMQPQVASMQNPRMNHDQFCESMNAGRDLHRPESEMGPSRNMMPTTLSMHMQADDRRSQSMKEAALKRD